MRVPQNSPHFRWSLAVVSCVSFLSAARLDAGIVYFGFDEAANNGGYLDAAYPLVAGTGPATIVTLAGSNAETASLSFFSAISGLTYGTEDFESFTTGQKADLPLSFDGTGITATLDGMGAIDATGSDPLPLHRAGRYAISGVNAWDTNKNELGFGINSFSSGVISAFGFFMTDAGDFNGQVQVIVSHESGAETLLTINHPFAPNNTFPGDPLAPKYNASLLFFGYLEESTDLITGFQFSNTNPSGDQGDRFGLDDITIAVGSREIVPEPATATMFLLGLLGVPILRRRNGANTQTAH